MTLALDELKMKARAARIPIIRDDTMALLSVLLRLKRPAYILEVGTAVGFSAAFMSRFLTEGGLVVSIEKMEQAYYQAAANLEKLGVKERVKLILGDASDVLRLLREPFDVIFLDAAKGQYLNWLPDCLRLLNQNGLLIADDVLQSGNLGKDRLAVPRRQRTVHTRMNGFLEAVLDDGRLATTVLPVGDGISVSVRTDK